ncbi:MAG: hypothetical protein MUC48_18160 [Leptolyngbya sp. Prado105]|jgi:hypothetical protein|nr:hypothetical protein [Leptolyngbya sp. Prado105]
MNLLQRTLATLSATGTAALMTLPALAQYAPVTPLNSGVAAPGATNCSAFVNGGIGGPIDNQTYSNQTAPSSSFSQTSPSSYDTASSGIQSNTSVPLGSGVAPSTPNQFQSGQSSNSRSISDTAYNTILQAAQSPAHRQFDANNRSAVLAFRSNGPAGTSGREAMMNLNAYQEGQNLIANRNLNETAIRLSAAPLPVACVPAQ